LRSLSGARFCFRLLSASGYVFIGIQDHHA
jgi:hypothetical protein